MSRFELPAFKLRLYFLPHARYKPVVRLAVRAWEVKDAGGFDEVFAAIEKERPDGLYVAGGPVTRANENRIVGFALKGRLPSLYTRRESVDAGVLLYYGADLADS